MFSVFIKVILISVLLDGVLSLNNGLGRTPPMGFMTWTRYRCTTDCNTFPLECVNDQLIRTQALRMVQDGFLDAGYEYIIIDDCWLSHTRDSQGRLQPDPLRFPFGIKALADYVHSLGLKFGIYEDYGTHTCGGYPGILGNLRLDAYTLASWGVDYIKLDGCYSNSTQQPEGYADFGRYLNETGRRIVYSCSYPAYQTNKAKINVTLLQKSCNLWRIFDDIDDSWDSVASIINFWKINLGNASMANWTGPGHWNDPDMLIIGNYGLSHGQQQTQMALWSIFSAPLLISVDLTTIPLDSVRILQNRLALSVNQDPLGVSGRPVVDRDYTNRQNKAMGNFQVWLKPMIHGQYAVALIHYSSAGTRYFSNLTPRQMGLPAGALWYVVDIFEESEIASHHPSDVPLPLFVNPSGSVRFLLFAPEHKYYGDIL